MAKSLLTGELWSFIEPHPPKPKRSARGGRPRAPDRACLTGVLFVLKTGIPWSDLPREAFGVSGMTCWRRLRDWQKAGVWKRLHERLLDELRRRDILDPDLAVIDSTTMPAVWGAPHRAQPHGPRENRLESPFRHRYGGFSACRRPHRGERERRDHAAAAAGRVAGDPRQARAALAQARPGHPDKAYHSREREFALIARGIGSLLPRRGTNEDRGLGSLRWVVERAVAWMRQFRRLKLATNDGPTSTWPSSSWIASSFAGEPPRGSSVTGS